MNIIFIALDFSDVMELFSVFIEHFARADIS